MNMRLHRQNGSTLVEMALVLILFLIIVFAVIEFSIAIVRSAQLAEATRDGLRYAITNDPVKEITLLKCATAGTVASEDCDSESCPDLIAGMANIAPLIISQEGMEDFSVNVRYACPVSGDIDRDDLYLVTVTVSGAKHYLTVPGILGLGVAINLHAFKSTRLSEDLHTAAGG